MDFEKRTWLFVGGVAVLAFVLGWGLKPTKTEVVEVQPTKSALSEVVTASKSSNRPDVSGWMRRLESENVTLVAGEIEDGEMRDVIEGLMAGMWGALTPSDEEQLQSLISEWEQRDFEACRAWSRGLQPSEKSHVALAMLAVARSETHLEDSVELLSELGMVDSSVLDIRGVDDLARNALGLAALEGHEDLLEALQKMPRSDSGSGFGIHYSESFDFAGLLDGLKEMEAISRENGKLPRAYTLASPMVDWASRDFSAALDYALRPENSSSESRWITLAEEYNAQKIGLPMSEIRSRLAEQLGSLSPAEFEEAVIYSGIENRWNNTTSKELMKYLDSERAQILGEYLVRWGKE